MAENVKLPKPSFMDIYKKYQSTSKKHGQERRNQKAQLEEGERLEEIAEANADARAEESLEANAEKPLSLLPAHFFPFKKDTISPLYCHYDDCGMNVFKALHLVSAKDALYIANATDNLNTGEIRDFLSNKFGVKFGLEYIYEKTNKKTLYDKKNAFKKLYSIPEGYAVIVFLHTPNKTGHFALMSKQKGIIYYVDPQAGNRQKKMVTQTFLKLLSHFDTISIFTSEGPPIKNDMNQVPHLQKKIFRRTTLNRLKHDKLKLNKFHRGIGANADAGIGAVQGVSGVETNEYVNRVNQNESHVPLTKGNTYKVDINRQFVGIGVFDKYSPHRQATFKNFKLQPGFESSEITFIKLKDKSNRTTNSNSNNSNKSNRKSNKKTTRKIKSA